MFICLFEYKESLIRCYIIDKLCYYYKALSKDKKLYLKVYKLYTRSLNEINDN
jgi:hypothetical protein